MSEGAGIGPFEDVALADAKARLDELAGADTSELVAVAVAWSPRPAQTLYNLERWLRSHADPSIQAAQLFGAKALIRDLITLLGSSQPMADLLIQNPELASLLFDAAERDKRPIAGRVLAEARSLMLASTSYSHALDRLRFLKQRWLLPIVMNDLAESWRPEETWLALSELADGLIQASLERAWTETRDPGPCPLMVVAFGKLGGGELNFSSDVDLVYVAPDGLDEEQEKPLARFCEAFGRALSDPMGRGFLYRLDLRLRPYGAAGPLTPSIRSIRNYYRSYSEPWERLALIRSRVLFGPPELVREWDALRVEHAFPASVSEASLESLISMRARIEERAATHDLKRGAGGIRDVEFLVQTLQFVHGHADPDLRVRSTCEALRALEASGKLDHSTAGALAEGYTFLRQLEHRIQLVADRQTHELPQDDAERVTLAKLSGAPSWTSLQRTLHFHRRTIETLYRSIVQPEQRSEGSREQIASELGSLAPVALHWFDPLPESEAFYDGLVANQGSLGRVRALLERAPAIVSFFRRSVPLTELLLSGEIEESHSGVDRLERLPLDTPIPALATAYADDFARFWARYALEPDSDPFTGQAALMDSLLRHCCRRLYATFDVLALGSYGRRDSGFGSDADVMLLIGDAREQPAAEEQAQNLLSLLQSLKRHGAPIELDLRLRPEGNQGLLVRTYDGFRAYELERMEMWERFALGAARLVTGSEEARDLALHAAYAMPLTPERLKDLVQMKRRIENERVAAPHARRNVKLGYGGLADIEWFVHLHEMRYPTATRVGPDRGLVDGIRALSQARLINAVEAEELLLALDHLLTVRTTLSLQGLPNDTVPENPDRLLRVARLCGDRDGNAFLRRHERVLDTVRSIYTEGMERLRA